MSRVIAVGPGGRAQAPVRDDRYRPVLEQVMSMGLMNQWVLSPAVQSEDRAREVKQGLYRSARYYCSCDYMHCTRKYGNVPGQNNKNPDGGCPKGGQRLSVQAEIVRDGEGFLRVQFRVLSKQEAMRAVVQKYGLDPNKWPYFARRKKAS
jgi:hypothetical protein